MMTPTVGRIVYYRNANDDIRAAIIVRVFTESCINLQVFGDPTNNELPVFGMTAVQKGIGKGEWDWMPYQKQKAAQGDHNSESAEPRPV